jgi:hypothetical protein
MAYINHTQQQNKRPLTAAEVGGPEEGDILTDGTDPTALFSRAFDDALGRNVQSYKRNPVMTRRNVDALEDARSEGFIDEDPLASRPRRRAQEDKLAVAEASNIGKLGVAGINRDARMYEADARRDVGTTAAGGRVNSSRVQGLMRQLEKLKVERAGLDPGSPEQEGSGLRGFLGFGTPHKPAKPADPRTGYIDSNVRALESQLQNEPKEYAWDEVEDIAREAGQPPEAVQRFLEAQGHAVYR